MKSLAILAATLAAAQASQDAGPGLGRLLNGTDDSFDVAEQWMKQMDTNDDWKIDWDEFKKFYYKNNMDPFAFGHLFHSLDNLNRNEQIDYLELDIGLHDISHLQK